MKKYQNIIICILSLILSIMLTGCFNKYTLESPNSLNNINEAIKGVVSIKCSHSASIMGSGDEATKSGTAFVFSEDSEYYYALTNYHIVYSGAWDSTMSVTNYLGETIEGRALKQKASYDCAIITFKKELSCVVLPLSSTNPNVNDLNYIIDGDFNYYKGNILNYLKAPELNYSRSSSYVKFDVYTSSCYTHKTSCGGPLLDSNYNVIGMMYAGYSSDSENNDYCYVIPVERLLKFIK